MYQCLAGLCGAFVILAVASVFAQPSKGALDNPPFREDDEPLATNRAQHSLQEPTKGLFDPGHQSVSAIGRISEQNFETSESIT